MVSALGDEHMPELESYTVALPDSVSVSALVPTMRRQLGSPGPETVLTVCYYEVAIVTVIIPDYYSL